MAIAPVGRGIASVGRPIPAKDQSIQSAAEATPTDSAREKPVRGSRASFEDEGSKGDAATETNKLRGGAEDAASAWVRLDAHICEPNAACAEVYRAARGRLDQTTRRLHP